MYYDPSCSGNAQPRSFLLQTPLPPSLSQFTKNAGGEQHDDEHVPAPVFGSPEKEPQTPESADADGAPRTEQAHQEQAKRNVLQKKMRELPSDSPSQAAKEGPHLPPSFPLPTTFLPTFLPLFPLPNPQHTPPLTHKFACCCLPNPPSPFSSPPPLLPLKFAYRCV